MRVTATVNGARQSADDVWEGESLLFVLRERMGLPGSKNACEQGECGSCTVYLDGVPVCACLVAAGQAQDREIWTVEGLGRLGAPGDPGPGGAGELHPVQQAFIEAGAVQCGFCTPGLLVAAHDLLARDPDPADADIREALAGNLCRCTGYEKILDAVRLAAARLRAAGTSGPGKSGGPDKSGGPGDAGGSGDAGGPGGSGGPGDAGGPGDSPRGGPAEAGS